MSGWRTIDLLCSSCSGEVHAHLVRTDEQDGVWECPYCEGGELRKAFLTAPAIMQRAFPDGKRRGDIRNQLEALRLETESYDLPPEKRKAISKEIVKLKGSK